MISYFSEAKNCFVAVGKRPIPAEAIIPVAELPRRKSLALKVWPATNVPDHILKELSMHVKAQSSTAKALSDS